MDPRTGEILLSKYKVLGVLGRGGMGVVYEAEDMRLGRHVAIKVLGARMRGRNQADERFLLEARAIAALMHPHLVTLLDYDVLDDGQPAMVMERVHGVSLKALMASRSFTPTEVMIVLHQTLQALQACHERGIVHRDLKPENLLVSPQGPQGMTVKVIDFGLTKLLADHGAASLTVNGQVFGSPRFMAPEQWLRKDVDGRTDIYALGLIGYCLLRGEHFITAQNPFEICRAHLSQARPALTTTSSGQRIPGELEQIVRRAADPNPNQRFGSASEMIQALEAFFGGLRGPLHTSGEIPTSVVDAAQERVTPFDAADMARSVEESISLDQTSASIAADFEEADPTRLESRAPSPETIETQLLQRALKLDVSGPVEAPAARDRVKFAPPGVLGTAITRGDVERALNDAALDAAEAPPVSAAPVVVPPEAVARVAAGAAAPRVTFARPTQERQRPTLQLDAVQPIRPLGLPTWAWLALSVVIAVLIGAGLARFAT
jgi:serine/threonine-protein kinase